MWNGGRCLSFESRMSLRLAPRKPGEVLEVPRRGRGLSRGVPKTERDRRRRRRVMQQNFLRDERVARRIVRAANIGSEEVIVEPGAGAGILTGPLSCRARRVVAVEYDPYWADSLRRRLAAAGNVEVLNADARTARLPEEEFRVVANVPFYATTALLSRFLDDPATPPASVHLLVQREVALKHARASPTTLRTLDWSPWYRFSVPFELPASAFHPQPQVDAALLVAARREEPLVAPGDRAVFRALVGLAFEGRGKTAGSALRPVFTRTQIKHLARNNGFSADRPPSRITVEQWASLFDFMVRSVPRGRWPGPGGRKGRNGRR